MASREPFQPVEIVEIPTPAGLVLRLRGEIDLSSVDEAGRVLLDAGAALPPPALVVLDLTPVGFLSAVGLRALLRFADRCAERGVRTHLVSTSDGIVRRVLRVSDADERIPAFDTVEQALHAAP